MAEGKKESKSSEESVKLFVGQVPKHMTEDEVSAMLKEFALVDEVNIIKDKITRSSRGCCFVTCPSVEEADKAVNACHNKITLPGASSPLQVKYADGELERLEHKVFIGMLPKNISEVEVSDLFSKYGTIKEIQILRGSHQTSKGCAFLKYETKEQSVAAIKALNGKHKMEGSSVPLVVKWADTEKERQIRRAQKAESQASSVPHADPQQPSPFGPLPMGYIPAYNGYAYQAPGGYGIIPYRLPPMQNHPAFHNMSPRNHLVPPANYIGSYPAVPVLQHPVVYPGGMISPRPVSGSSGSVSPRGGNNNCGQIEGPPGANLFIYHIPQEFGDEELATAFQPFGRVLSAKIFVDKATGLSKCFGFVSYDIPEAAEAAIINMNGYQLGGKKLKVQHKRGNKQSKPY